MNPFLPTSIIGKNVRITFRSKEVITGVFLRIELIQKRHFYVIKNESGVDLIPAEDILLLSQV